MGWMQHLSWFDGVEFEPTTETEHNAFVCFRSVISENTLTKRQYVKSIVVPESKPLSKETLKAYFQFMKDAQIEEGQVRHHNRSNNPSCSLVEAYFAQVNLYGGHDSQINAKSNSLSSYAHRDSLWVFQHYGHTKSHEPPLSDSTVHFISALDATITDADEEGKYGAYLNYVDPELSREEAGRKYYGEEVLKNLERIKTDVDPDEVFWHPLSIRPAGK
jgi:FAD/FMN-containing dehydrogenase